jgi:hypothetical protein
MIYNSNGGFTWGDIYHMPIKLRDFYWNELIKAKKTESEQIESAQRGKASTSSKARRK